MGAGQSHCVSFEEAQRLLSTARLEAALTAAFKELRSAGSSSEDASGISKEQFIRKRDDEEWTADSLLWQRVFDAFPIHSSTSSQTDAAIDYKAFMRIMASILCASPDIQKALCVHLLANGASKKISAKVVGDGVNSLIGVARSLGFDLNVPDAVRSRSSAGGGEWSAEQVNALVGEHAEWCALLRVWAHARFLSAHSAFRTLDADAGADDERGEALGAKRLRALRLAAARFVRFAPHAARCVPLSDGKRSRVTSIFDERLWTRLAGHVPALFDEALLRVYCSATNGFSLFAALTRLDRVAKAVVPLSERSVLLLTTADGVRCGAVFPSRLRSHDEQAFGTGKPAALFFVSPDENTDLRWFDGQLRADEGYVFCTREHGVGVGGQLGYHGLYVDAAFDRGHWHACRAFRNEPLFEEKDGEFHCARVELYAFVPWNDELQAMQSALERGTDAALFEEADDSEAEGAHGDGSDDDNPAKKSVRERFKEASFILEMAGHASHVD